MFSRLLSRTRPPTDYEIARELRDHLELDAEELAERGAGDDARFAAQRRFGNVSLTIEATRDEWGEIRWRRLAQDLGTDIAYGIKRLRHAPGFALLTVLTTAIGVGATTAIFSVVNAVVLRPIPIADADRVVAFYETNPTNNAWTTSDPNFLDYRERTRSFATMAAVAGRSADGLRGSCAPAFGHWSLRRGVVHRAGASPRIGRAARVRCDAASHCATRYAGRRDGGGHRRGDRLRQCGAVESILVQHAVRHRDDRSTYLHSSGVRPARGGGGRELSAGAPRGEGGSTRCDA